MKTFKQSFVLLAIFLALGETIVRIDKKFLFFQGSRFVEVAVETRRSPELVALNANAFAISPRDLRVMVLGDSKIYGPGVDFREVFSQRLKALLAADKSLPYDNIFVLDLSHGGYNTLMNRLTYFQYVEKFQPQLVVLGNNYEDVYGNQDAPASMHKSNLGTHAQLAEIFEQTKNGENTPRFQHIREAVYHSSLLEFILAGVNLELKLRGVVVPGSVFHHLIYESHHEEYVGWVKAKAHLRDLIIDCKQRGAALIVYASPELNMIDNYAPYDTLDHTLSEFFASYAIPYLHDVSPFRGGETSDFALSRYNGHANAKGHQVMAQQVYPIIVEALPRVREVSHAADNLALKQLAAFAAQ